MNILSISTGGFYLYAMAYGAAYTQGKMEFGAMVGASAGAVIAAVSAIHGGEKMLAISKKIDLRRAYSYIPFKPNGKMKLRSVARFLCGKSLAIQDGRKVIKEVISKEDFQTYRSDPNAPECYVLTIEMQQSQTHLWRLKGLNYENAINAIEASTRMQGIAKGLYWQGGYHVDGGQRDHVPSHHLLSEKVSNLVSIYSWPKDWKLPPMTIGEKEGIKEHFRMIGIDNNEKALNDMEREKRLCDQYSINRFPIYTDRTLLHSFDVDKNRQLAAQLSTLNSAKETLKSYIC